MIPTPKSKDLQTWFIYDPAGHLLWAKSPNWSIPVGTIAGCLDKKTGYTRVRFLGTYYKLHRLIWAYCKGDPVHSEIDHINGNRSDNRVENLRLVARVNNAWNKKKPRNNKSGVKGVCWHNKTGKWQVNLRVSGKCMYFGLFEDLELAELVAQEAREKYHGEYARHA